MKALSDSPPDPPPDSLRALVERFDAEPFDAPAGRARIRLVVSDLGSEWDVLVDEDERRTEARLVSAPARERADALLIADLATWKRIADDMRHGMDAFRQGRLSVRRDLHLGVGLLAATSGETGPERLELSRVETEAGRLAVLQAGAGEAVVLVHGLGASKASFLPTVDALAQSYRVIAVDLPGFGDSDKPFGAPYDADFFARAVIALLDSLEIERAHLVGNSMGGRTALEVGLQAPERVGRLALLCSALAWRRERRWAPLVRAIRPELGLLQLTPRGPTKALVRRLVVGAANDNWAASGVDEFLRAYLTSRGRAAFYASARQIYLEEADGENGFWSRLESLEPDPLFVWGVQDTLVPIAFKRHVGAALPQARHLTLDCGHVPQLERPRETHAAIDEFFAGGAPGEAGPGRDRTTTAALAEDARVA